ncbi:MAG: Uma2 family endonuclease [Thermoanaerobaculia bacterium]
MTVDARLFTADELLRLPEDGCRFELVEGELKKMSPAGGRHGRIAHRISHGSGAENDRVPARRKSAVVVVDPWKRIVQIHRARATETITTTVTGVLEVDDVVPGWRLPLDDIFSA